MVTHNLTTGNILGAACVQVRSVAWVDELMRLCGALEAALVREAEVKGRLLEAVLAGPPAAGPCGAQVKKYEEAKGQGWRWRRRGRPSMNGESQNEPLQSWHRPPDT